MSFTSIIDLLEINYKKKPEEVVYTFLEYKDSNRYDINLNYKDVYDNARKIAVKLFKSGLRKGDRVIIFSTQKYDNIYSIYGTLFAGAIFTLVPPPIDEGKMQRFVKILNSSDAKFILCDNMIFNLIKNNSALSFIDDKKCKSINVDTIHENPYEWVKCNIDSDDLAYLQFSSGSTSFPKGVMISHKNIIHNLESLSQLFEGERLKNIVSWVPFFHNIGLVAFVFFNMFYDFRSIIMSPKSFVENPIRWLEVISEFKSNATAGPNSAYALCAKIIKEEDLKRIDLSSLRYALNGSEPINCQSLQAFKLKFGQGKFDSFSFCPAYGLAESTMFVSGSNRNVTVKRINYSDFQRNLFVENDSDDGRKKEVISVGKLFNNAEVAIVDTTSGKECKENEIGEIWLQSDSVAKGYWNMVEETEKTFKGVLENHDGFFLKTGDLGAISGGELYITGRCKELIIINGHNLYPYDIELNIKENIKLMALCPMSIFSISIKEKEKVVICIEANTEGMNIIELINQINDTVHKSFDITPFDVFFVKEGSLPRTDNGKIQMFKVKEIYESGRLKNKLNSLSKAESSGLDKAKNEITDEIELKIKNIFNQIIKTSEEFASEDSFFSLGGDSLDTVHLVNLLENEFEVKIILKELVENPTIMGIANYIKELKNSEQIITDKKYLYAECELPLDIIPKSYQNFNNSSPKNIFLTGSTGFLSAYLIRDMIEDTTANIYCHVRARDEENGLVRIKTNMEKYKIWKDEYTKRIKPVLGDLTKPLMGIEENYYNDLAEKIDTVYHNGALLNFIFPYSHLKKTNVDGTIECLRFACKDKAKYFNYISTFSVYDNPSHFKTLALEDDELKCGEGFFLGYSETKWVSEKLVRSAEKRGLNVSIYRPGDITGDSKNGIWEMGDLVSRVINACIQMEAIPDINVNVYITPIDFISKAIVNLSTNKDSIGKALNLINKNIASVRELHAIINYLGYNVKLTPYKEWQKMLFKDADSNVLKILECLFIASECEETSIVRRYGDIEADFDISNTLKGLEGTGIKCTELDINLIYKYLYNFAVKGYIKYPNEILS